jgi:aryl-alcohol dehydrogenase-like predicted oxidoreductase
MMLPTRKLGPELEVSALGLGCMGMSWAYGPSDGRKEMIRLLREQSTSASPSSTQRRSTAPYTNEQLVGEGLEPVRDHAVIATVGKSIPSAIARVASIAGPSISER